MYYYHHYYPLNWLQSTLFIKPSLDRVCFGAPGVYILIFLHLDIKSDKKDNLENAESSLESLTSHSKPASHKIPTERHITRANMALHLDQFNPTIKQENSSSKEFSLPGFMVPSKAVKKSSGVADGFMLPQPSKRKNVTPVVKVQKKKMKVVETPSSQDITVLHQVKQNATRNKKVVNTAKVPKHQVNSTTPSVPEKLLEELKLGDLGNLGEARLGDIGNLGASRSLLPAGHPKTQEPAWKRKLEVEAATNTLSSSHNPETPSNSDLGEIATYKKEVAAAIKGLGPEANLVMKKSRVPTPRHRYWGVNYFGGKTNGRDEVPGLPGGCLILAI